MPPVFVQTAVFQTSDRVNLDFMKVSDSIRLSE